MGSTAEADHTLSPETGYAAGLRVQLRALWLDVLRQRAPQVADSVESGPRWSLQDSSQAIPYLQACNIWFQLLKIIDENAAMRDRRIAETQDGPQAVEGSFARVLAWLGDETKPAYLA